MSQTTAQGPAEVIARDEQEIEQPGTPPMVVTHPLQIFERAVEKGINIDKMRELRDMVDWWETKEAKKAFNKAMAGFRSETIEIIKDRHVKFKNKSGGFTEYDHETLDQVVDAAVPHLSTYGLSHSWEITKQEPKWIEVTTIVTHEMGHERRVPLGGPPDESGGKNAVQAIASTVHYLERYGLLAALGLAAKGHDTDGRPPSDADPDAISEAQATILKKLIDDTGTKLESFLGFAQIETLDDLPAARFAECKDMLERRKANLQSKGAK